jgi:signal transduction histidine kinase
VSCTLDAPQQLPPLPAALEVAVLRIVLEAVTNVVRHSGATACAVRLAIGERRVVVEVDDDGRGIPADADPGVGLSSMRERAEEVGGILTVAARAEAGTRVRAVLPLLRAPEGVA